MASTVRELFRKIVLLIFLVLTVLPVMLETFGNLSHKSYLLAFLAACLLFAAIWFSRGIQEKLRDRINGCSTASTCILLSVLCLLVNGLFAFFFVRSRRRITEPSSRLPKTCPLACIRG